MNGKNVCILVVMAILLYCHYQTNKWESFNKQKDTIINIKGVL